MDDHFDRQRRLIETAIRYSAAAILAVVGAPALPAQTSVAISPHIIEKVVRPGQGLSDIVSFTNSGKEPAQVSLELADFTVDENGKAHDRPPGTEPSSLAPFLRIAPPTVRVAPQQTVNFRYSAQLPAAFTHYRVMIYFLVRPVTALVANGAGFLIVPRLGVPLYAENIGAKPASLHIDSIFWARSPEGSLYADLQLRNDGQRNIRPQGLVFVRSANGRFARQFPFNEGREPVLPSQSRQWHVTFGPVPRDDLSVDFRLTTSATKTFHETYEIAAAR
ncbi:MAG TPA: hypothetical protein VER58_10360 [Thermoanaerobaculia bacterium]|nr:hypothetical protein [Thermoanaerobaculia bacterium]